jgi:hypothetical protein
MVDKCEPVLMMKRISIRGDMHLALLSSVVRRPPAGHIVVLPINATITRWDCYRMASGIR